MRELPIDFEEIAVAMEDYSGRHEYGNEYYLDTHLGELVVIPSELQCLHSFDEEVIAKLPEWEQTLVPIVQEIEEGSDRYVQLPMVPSSEVYDLMVEFLETVSNPQLYSLLSVALQGKGAFGRFKRVLDDHSWERERWFKMKQAAMTERIREWLNGLGIEPVEKR